MNIFYKTKQKNRGMTYIEIIVVLSIFSVVSSVTLFNYRRFQEKVDIKTLANDVALKFVQAQKESVAGKVYAGKIPVVNPWKPSYGLAFNMSTPKGFMRFVDLDHSKTSDSILCTGNECLEKITITGTTSVSALTAYYLDGSSAPLADLDVTFTRPDSVATFRSTTNFTSAISYAEIKFTSPQGIMANIKVFASGRIQIN